MAAKKTTYENTATRQREELDPKDPETQRRVQSGELREVPAEPGSGSHAQR